MFSVCGFYTNKNSKTDYIIFKIYIMNRIRLLQTIKGFLLSCIIILFKLNESSN